MNYIISLQYSPLVPGDRGLPAPLPPRPVPERELHQPRGPALLLPPAPGPEVILPRRPRPGGEAARLPVSPQLPGPHLRPRAQVWQSSSSPSSARGLEPKNVLESVPGTWWPLRRPRLWAPPRRGRCAPSLGRAPHFRIGRHQSFKFRKK